METSDVPNTFRLEFFVSFQTWMKMEKFPEDISLTIQEPSNKLRDIKWLQ